MEKHQSFLIILFGSCQTEELQVVTVQNGPPGVYVGGQDSGGNATFWKDGLPTLLPGVYAKANFIFVNGNDTYLAGKTNTGFNTNAFVYWKNGTSNTILDLNAENLNSQLGGFAVSGNDLHAVWTENKGAYSIIKYWKNGSVNSITNENHFAKANAIAAYGNDIYICGYESTGGLAVAKYWKNGKVFPLTNSTGGWSAANSIFIYNGDVYVAGVVGTSPDISKNVDVATYWKNGVAVDISDGTKNAIANSIFVNDAGVYTAGVEAVSAQSGINIAKYWKNSIVSSLTDGALHGFAYQIWVVDNDVYVVGRDGSSNTVWKNGTKLAPFDTNDPAVLPLCISVIK